MRQRLRRCDTSADGDCVPISLARLDLMPAILEASKDQILIAYRIENVVVTIRSMFGSIGTAAAWTLQRTEIMSLFNPKDDDWSLAKVRVGDDLTDVLVSKGSRGAELIGHAACLFHIVSSTPVDPESLQYERRFPERSQSAMSILGHRYKVGLLDRLRRS